MDDSIASSFRTMLEHMEGADSAKIVAFAAAYHNFQDDLERLLAGPSLTPRGKAQSTQFMTHLLPVIHAHMRQFPRGSSFSILDVGPGTGNGSDLLGFLYSKKGIGYGAKVTTIDIRSNLQNYMKVFCRYTHPIMGDIFKLTQPYDIVLASHVIEHVARPLQFVRQMQKLSRGLVLVCAPYKEPAEKLSPAHRNILEDDFLDQLDSAEVKFVESPGWGQFMDPPYKMFIASLKGSYPKYRYPPKPSPSMERTEANDSSTA